MSFSSSLGRFSILALVMIGLSGCGALEEIDKANAKMPNSKKKTAKVAPTTATSEAEASNPLVERSKKWWGQAKSLTSSAPESSIVRCQLSSGAQFMDRDDCRARGGRVSS